MKGILGNGNISDYSAIFPIPQTIYCPMIDSTGWSWWWRQKVREQREK